MAEYIEMAEHTFDAAFVGQKRKEIVDLAVRIGHDDHPARVVQAVFGAVREASYA